MQTNNPLYRFFIEKLLSNQSDSELAIPFAVIITERQADKMTEKDFADILSSLIKFKRTNFLINFIIKHENLIINEHISLLIITALDEKQIDIATFLIEFVIRFNIELDKESFTHLFEKLLNTYNYSLLVLIFNAQLISKYKIDLHDHTHLIKTIEGYWFLRQYGFHLNLIDFINTPKKIISISDYLLNELLTTKYQQERTSFIDYIKNNEHRVTEFIIRLLVLDKEKTLFQWASLFSKKKLKKNPELHGILSFKKKLEDILLNSYTKKCFIRSRAMFIFLSTILPEKIDSTYLSKYLINLCEFPPGYNPTNDIRGLYHLRDTNTGQRKYNDSLDEFAANTAEPLHLLEHEFASELDEFSEDIKLNLRNIKVQDIGSYLPFLALSAARNKCYQLLVLFFEFHINFIPDDILLDIFNHLIAKKEYGLINDLFNYLPEDSGIQLTLFEEFIDGVDCQFLDKILANNQDYLLENQEILFRSTHVNFPHVAKKLMK
ncbi:MAG TPA: hypothetical protein VHZ76_05940, partial [Gammaproteobacteria bacterium]|nr:hypothetical protein [Gammaproteobacteria bacterium]